MKRSISEEAKRNVLSRIELTGEDTERAIDAIEDKLKKMKNLHTSNLFDLKNTMTVFKAGQEQKVPKDPFSEKVNRALNLKEAFDDWLTCSMEISYLEVLQKSLELEAIVLPPTEAAYNELYNEYYLKYVTVTGCVVDKN